MIYIVAKGGQTLNKIITKREKTMTKMPSITKVAAYARVSSGKDEMLHSLAAQVSQYSRHIRNHPRWTYAGVYADEAMTGTKNNRPEFKRLIEDCYDGKIDLVITKSISRFARNTLHLLETVRELKSIGVDVFFEEQNIHSMSSDGELMLSVLGAFYQAEALSVSENCKWRIRKQFENGELANLRFMFGYRIVKGKVEINEEEAAIVRMIFHDYISGMGGRKIAEKLREMEIDRPLGGQWRRQRVIDIIKNEKYTGNALLQKKFVEDYLSKKLVRNKGQMPRYYAEGTHLAIIDQETFNTAQAVMHERSLKYEAKSGSCNSYPFTSMIQCGICGKNYKRKVQRGKVAWYCSTYQDKGKAGCPSKKIPENVLFSLSNEMLGLDEFDASVFEEEIVQITVPKQGKLVFEFKDGHTVEKNWQYRSRRESWTDEMREKAREHARRGCEDATSC